MIRPPIELTPTTVADWLEASQLSDDAQERIADATVQDELEQANVEETEVHLANLRGEVSRREQLLGPRYPLTRNGLGFRRKVAWQECLPYSFLLLVSLNQLYRPLVFQAGSANVPAELFESLAGAALKNYVGGEAIRIGAPRRQPVPAAFPHAVRYLADQLSETFGYGELEIQQGGDDGIDIVVWKPFNDRLSSQLVVLAQCAIGTDWKEKRSSLDLNVWGRHIRWATAPLRAFAVPFQHELGGIWEETGLRGGIILDRARIVANLPDPALPAAEIDRLRQWCVARLRRVRGLADVA